MFSFQLQGRKEERKQGERISGKKVEQVEGSAAANEDEVICPVISC